MAKSKKPATKRPAVEVRPLGEGSLELLMYGEIGGYAEDSDERICAARVARVLAESPGVKSIHLRINSPGGDAFEGVAIHNLLAQHPARIEVDIDAYALSAASLVAMAGDNIRMADNALMMIHDPWTVAIGSSADMADTSARLGKMADVMARTYAARCGKSVDDMRALMAAETWLTAQDALAAGLCDEVREPAVRMAACPMTPETMARFRAAPEALRSLLLGDEVTAAPATDTVSAQAIAPAQPGKVGDTMSQLLKLLGAEDEASAVVALSELNKVQAAAIAERDTLAAKLTAAQAESTKLAERIAALESERVHAEHEALIASLSEAGKLPPSLHDWARSQSLDCLRAYGEKAPSAKPAIQPPVSDEVALTEEDLRVMAQHGITRDQFIAARKAEKAAR